MKKRKMGGLFTFPMVASSVILLIILIASLFGTALSPYDPDAIDLANTFAGFSSAHWFGTDEMGRDMLSRMNPKVSVNPRARMSPRVSANPKVRMSQGISANQKVRVNPRVSANLSVRVSPKAAVKQKPLA